MKRGMHGCRGEPDREEGGRLHCRWTGAADLFDPADLDVVGRDFEMLLAAAADGAGDEP